MLQNEKSRKVARVAGWAIVAFLSVVSLVLLVLNYQKMEQAAKVSEESAFAQARNVRYYAHEYKVTKVSLEEANEKILVMTKQLEEANTELAATRGEIASLQKLNDEFKASIASLERDKVKYQLKEKSLEDLLSSFKEKNRKLDADLQVIRKEFAKFQPDIKDPKEGQEKIKRFKNQIHLVKKNIGAWKKKASEERAAVQKERDRIEAAYGNGGFLIRNGKDLSVTNSRGKDVNIDVKFLNR